MRIVVIVLPLLALTLAAQSSPRDPFERARMLEESNQNLPDALALYAQVVEQSRERELAATAQLRIGLLCERLGRKDEAQRAFRIVVERYGDQTQVVRQALARTPSRGTSAAVRLG